MRENQGTVEPRGHKHDNKARPPTPFSRAQRPRRPTVGDRQASATMPIRFRCAYCNQLLGIARLKYGTVVRCPTCAGQVVVPNSDDGPVEEKNEQEAPPAPAGGQQFFE